MERHELAQEERLRRVWIGRGRVIKTRYPDAAVRRQIYRTSLAPRSALTLVASIDAIRNRLVQGAGYAALNADERLTFVGDIIELLSRVPTFHVDAGLGPRRDFREWRDVLRWWLAKDTLTSRLLKNTRIGLFSWPSCVSRPPPTTVRTGDTLSRRGGQRHPRPAIRDTSPPDSATGPSYRRWRRR